jgi:serine/threonine-protein kinase
VDKYVVQGPLASGTWGRVFEARHARLGSEVAIKVLISDEEGVRARFEREAQTAAGLQHRNILEVYDVGNLDDGTPYLVMERLRGQDLAAQLEDGPLTIDAAVDLGRQLTAAVAAIADAGVVHRDIKPQNVVLHHEGDEVVVKLVDFGVSKSKLSGLSATTSIPGIVVGTPPYMSPEQVRGDELDARSDLYSVGVVLYECLTGTLPFEAVSVERLAASILDDPPPPIRDRRPDCPKTLEAIVMRILSKRREDRQADPRELARDLERVAETMGLETGSGAWAPLDLERSSRVSIPAPRASEGSERLLERWVALAVIALIAIVVAIALGWIGP